MCLFTARGVIEERSELVQAIVVWEPWDAHTGIDTVGKTFERAIFCVLHVRSHCGQYFYVSLTTRIAAALRH